MKKGILCGISCAVFVAAAPGLFALDVGDKAPPFVNFNLQRQRVWSRDYIGKGWLLIDFFATDCDGCKKEFPAIEGLSRDLAAEGLSVLVFATDPDGEGVLDSYFQKAPTQLAILVDRYQVAAKKFGVSEIPAVFLVDPAGRIAYKTVGYTEELPEHIRSLVSRGN